MYISLQTSTKDCPTNLPLKVTPSSTTDIICDHYPPNVSLKPLGESGNNWQIFRKACYIYSYTSLNEIIYIHYSGQYCN